MLMQFSHLNDLHKFSFLFSKTHWPVDPFKYIEFMLIDPMGVNILLMTISMGHRWKKENKFLEGPLKDLKYVFLSSSDKWKFAL